MTEYPKFVDQFNHLIDQNSKEVTFTTHAKLAKILNPNGILFIGILMNKSIVIPFTSNADTEDSIKNIVRVNNMDLQKKFNEPHAEVACRLLGLNFNGENSGFYSDGTSLAHSNIMVLHVYPKKRIDTQEQFTDQVTTMFIDRGCTMSIEETI